MSNELEKRKSFRLEINILVRYRFVKKESKGHYRASNFFKGVGENFSGCGAAIKVGRPIPAGTLVYLEIYFPLQPYPIKATAEVLRMEKVMHGGKEASLIMVNYIIINVSEQDKMTGFLISRDSKV